MRKKRVLVCPMDWGLGHATRDVVIIHQLNQAGFEVILGADRAPLFFLRQTFPEMPFIVIPSINIRYPEKGSLMALKMLFLMPKMISGIIREHRFLKIILKSDHIDILISDNRYGMWNNSVYCIFITHQLHILAPKFLKWLEYPLFILNKWFIRKFNECWIPDFEGNINLSGKLSHLKEMPVNAHFIGPLSRFLADRKEGDFPALYNSGYDVMIILSGPEPQRSILERILLEQASSMNLKFLVVQGRPETNVFAQSATITIVHHLQSGPMAKLIAETPVIIARSGYSTIMDMVLLKKSAILIATPGQTEQEYLAKYMTENKWFLCKSQNDFILSQTLEEFKSFSPVAFPNIKIDLRERLNKLF